MSQSATALRTAMVSAGGVAQAHLPAIEELPEVRYYDSGSGTRSRTPMSSWPTARHERLLLS